MQTLENKPSLVYPTTLEPEEQQVNIAVVPSITLNPKLDSHSKPGPDFKIAYNDIPYEV